MNWVIYCSGIAIREMDVTLIRLFSSASGGSEISGIAEKGAGSSSLPVFGAGIAREGSLSAYGICLESPILKPIFKAH